MATFNEIKSIFSYLIQHELGGVFYSVNPEEISNYLRTLKYGNEDKVIYFLTSDNTISDGSVIMPGVVLDKYSFQIYVLKKQSTELQESEIDDLFNDTKQKTNSLLFLLNRYDTLGIYKNPEHRTKRVKFISPDPYAGDLLDIKIQTSCNMVVQEYSDVLNSNPGFDGNANNWTIEGSIGFAYNSNNIKYTTVSGYSALKTSANIGVSAGDIIQLFYTVIENPNSTSLLLYGASGTSFYSTTATITSTVGIHKYSLTAVRDGILDLRVSSGQPSGLILDDIKCIKVIRD